MFASIVGFSSIAHYIIIESAVGVTFSGEYFLTIEAMWNLYGLFFVMVVSVISLFLFFSHFSVKHCKKKI